MPQAVGVVLAAGGGGVRYGARKQFLEIRGRPLIHFSLDVFAALDEVREVVVVCPPDAQARTSLLLEAWGESAVRGERLRLATVPGGRRRQDSVLAGLRALSASAQWALVHDVARPLVDAADVARLLAAFERHEAAVLGTPCHDSVKRVAAGRIVEELPREEVWTVQTPQGARLSLLRQAYEEAAGADWSDEASVLRHHGVDVALVEGPRENIKITRPGDERLAERLLELRARQER